MKNTIIKEMEKAVWFQINKTSLNNSGWNGQIQVSHTCFLGILADQ